MTSLSVSSCFCDFVYVESSDWLWSGVLWGGVGRRDD